MLGRGWEKDWKRFEKGLDKRFGRDLEVIWKRWFGNRLEEVWKKLGRDPERI